ncbi:MAG: HAD family hydrolase [Verrucomicrobiota bacterium]
MLYVFDLDDTLYLEIRYVQSAFQAIDRYLKEQRLASSFFEISWEIFTNGSHGQIFQQALTEEGIKYDDALIQKLLRIYQTHPADIKLIEDARHILELIRSLSEHETALITDGTPVLQWNKIKALQLESLIGTIIVTDDYGSRQYRKPHTRAFKAIQGQKDPDECIYIADNPAKDFIAPRELGWNMSVRIRREGSLYRAQPTPSDCYEITTLEVLSYRILQDRC